MGSSLEYQQSPLSSVKVSSRAHDPVYPVGNGHIQFVQPNQIDLSTLPTSSFLPTESDVTTAQFHCISFQNIMQLY